MNFQLQPLFNRIKPFLAVFFLQVGYAGFDLISKVALNDGVSTYVIIVYRHIVATAVLAPFAGVLDRNEESKMTFPIFVKIVALAILGPVLGQNLYLLGMKYTTATLAAALTNTLPALAVLLAFMLRLEKIEIKKVRTHAKLFGTAAAIAGAVIITLVKGPVIELFWIKGKTSEEDQRGGSDLQHAVKGCIMITLASFGYACFMILQAITAQSYSAHLSLATWICLLASIEGTVVALVMERGKATSWSIHWDSKLLAVLYSGIICSGLTYYIQGIAMKERGPVFVSAFSPLRMVIVAAIGSFFLGEQMYLGRILGAVVIVVGLYLVVWGKAKDHRSPTPSTNENDQAAQGNANRTATNSEV